MCCDVNIWFAAAFGLNWITIQESVGPVEIGYIGLALVAFILRHGEYEWKTE